MGVPFSGVTIVAFFHLVGFKSEGVGERGVAVVGCSTDTEQVHLAWLMTPKDNGGIEGVKYPLVADVTKTVAYNFGVLAGDWGYNEENQLEFICETVKRVISES